MKDIERDKEVKQKYINTYKVLVGCNVGDKLLADGDVVKVIKKTKGGHVTLRFHSGREVVITPNMYMHYKELIED